ncbi:hypothetical protein ACFFRR_004302 [Megaselia abdita]
MSTGESTGKKSIKKEGSALFSPKRVLSSNTTPRRSPRVLARTTPHSISVLSKSLDVVLEGVETSDDIVEEELSEDCSIIEVSEITEANFFVLNGDGKVVPTDPFPISQSSSKYSILKTLLINAGLPSEYLDLFKEKGICDRSLSHLDRSQIQDVFIGFESVVICSFYNALVVWKLTNQGVVQNYKTEKMPAGFKAFKKCHIDIKTILNEDLSGQQAIRYFRKENTLSPYHRTKVIHIVIDFLIRNHIWVENPKFAEVTQHILDFFNYDDKDAYVSIQLI